MVSIVRKFDKIEAIPKRVSHIRDSPIFPMLHVSIKRCAEFQSTGNGPVKIFDDEIEVDGCPMSFEAACDLLISQVCNQRSISEQKDRYVSSFEFNPGSTEPSLESERQSFTVESDTALEISNLDVRVNREHKNVPFPRGATIKSTGTPPPTHAKLKAQIGASG